MAKIVFFDVWPEMVPYLKKKLKQHQLTFLTSANSATISLAAQAEIVCTTIHARLGALQITKMPHLKYIATLSTGFDHIDLAVCSKKKILVANVPAYGSQTVAEHTIALMLAVVKKIVQSAERTRQGNFSLDGLRTMDVFNKILGIFGFGKIGYQVAKIAKAFGMQVLIYDPNVDTELVENLEYKNVSLDRLLNKSDIISLHAPLTPKTKHIINNQTLAKMKKGAIIINTARGGLIDTQALVHALVSGHIGGAGLDVLEIEKTIKEELQLISPEYMGSFDLRTVIANQMLCNQPNVLITPHNAFNSQEALQRIIDMTLENIAGFLKRKPINIVNPKARKKS
jgi:D-lactate dehydrogenase